MGQRYMCMRLSTYYPFKRHGIRNLPQDFFEMNFGVGPMHINFLKIPLNDLELLFYAKPVKVLWDFVFFLFVEKELGNLAK